MTPVQWTLFAVGLFLLAIFAGVLMYTTWATLTGRRSVSDYLKAAPRWVVALIAFGTGLVVGTLFAHWWFPTTGDLP